MSGVLYGKRLLALAVLAAGLLLQQSCSRTDMLHPVRVVKMTNSLLPATPGSGHVLWVHQLPDAAVMQMSATNVVCDRDRVIVLGSEDFERASIGRGSAPVPHGGITALAAKDGSLLWSNGKIGLPSLSDAVVKHGILYASDFHGTAFAVDLSTSRIKWRAPGGDLMGNRWRPVADSSRVYVRNQTVRHEETSNELMLEAVLQRSGSITWRSLPRGLADVALDERTGRLFLLYFNGAVETLNSATGHVLKNARVVAAPPQKLLRYQGSLLVIGASSVQAVDSNSFHRLWETPLAGTATGFSSEQIWKRNGESRCGYPASLHGEHLDLESEDGSRILQINVRTGAVEWSHPTAATADSCLFTVDGGYVVYAARHDPDSSYGPTRFYWLRESDGRQAGTVIVQNPIRKGYSVMAQSGPFIYVATRDAVLAIKKPD